MDPALDWQAMLLSLANRNYWNAMFLLEQLEEWIGQGAPMPPYITREVVEAIKAGIRDQLID